MYSSTVERFAGSPADQFALPPRRASTYWCTMRRDIAGIARAENARWTGRHRRKLREGEPSQLPLLTQYWSAVPGFESADVALRAARRSAAGDPRWPWSAAFICFVMRAAGVQRTDGFEFGPRHMSYVVGALRNRERSDRSRPFWLVDLGELEHEVAPQAGDLLCFNRLIARGVTSQHSYASLRRQFWSGGRENTPPTGSSHCRIVVGAGSSVGQQYLETIGGNESDSVRLQTVPIDQFGNIRNPQGCNVFGMIKLINCQ
jgi:hypothetical protein